MLAQFSCRGFTCDVEVYSAGPDLVLRFFHRRNEPDIVPENIVIVDHGLGYLCLKRKPGGAALLSGVLDERAFPSEEFLHAAIELVEKLAPDVSNAYMPYHIERYKTVGAVEYNGEY